MLGCVIKGWKLVGFFVVMNVIGVNAATFTVTNTNDSGAGSLRQAVLDSNAAAGNDTINFDASFNSARTITVASVVTVTGNGGLTIDGPGAGLLTVSGNNATHIFELSGLNSPSIGAIIFNNFTIADGFSAASGISDGGGISINHGAGTFTSIVFTANNVTFRNNSGGVNEGGAIGCTKLGTVNINNSTFTGNSSNGGGAIDLGTGTGTCSSSVSNSSFYGNTTTGGDYVIACCGNGTGTLAITNSVLYNNGRNGGRSTVAMTNGGGLTMTNTTVANNRGGAAALSIAMNNTLAVNTLTNVTIAGNYAASSSAPGGLDQTANINIVSVGNSIIANNFNAAGPSDLAIGSNNTFTSQGYNLLETVVGTIGGITTGNLIGVDPWLDGLARDNGGTTKSLALRPGSPAIDTGNPTTFPATDQRGIARPQDGDGTGGARSDIGAFERRPIDSFGKSITDFDGDGKTDISIFRPSGAASEWWWLKSSTGGNAALQFGASTDRLAPVDFTGDGKTDVAFWRPSTGQWFVLRSEDFSFYAFPFGATGDVPVPGDFDGDGKADAAVFRESSLTWFISKSSGGTDIVGFGAAGDKPVNADYDGDGKSDIAIFRPSGANGAEWWVRRSSNASVFALQFGAATDKAVPGDFTGDGKADVAFWRPSTGAWNVLRSEDFSYYAFPFGANGDVASPGDYDGDGKIDAAVFRPSNSTWYANRSTAGTLIQQFGIAGDVPVPNAFVR